MDMAHAYETFASGGDLIYGTLSPGAENTREEAAPGPVGIERITKREDGKSVPIELPNGEDAVNRKERRNVLEHSVATEVGSLLQGVVRDGTGTRAQVAGTVIAGKTGTTEGYGDAWFVGWSPQYTVAVWVGYPNEFKSMKTEYQGQAVAGGTFPAGIFQTFMASALRIHPPKDDEETPTTTAPVPGATAAPTAPPTTPTQPAPEPTQTPVPTAPPAATAQPGGDEAPDPTQP
jgi:penicillin-binding protein 1A